MDKLRALQYFVATADARSFSGAARRMEVSIPAVAKLVSALEKSLGVSLFDRSNQGLSATPEGLRYLESCRPLLEQLEEADEALAPAAARVRGELVVGAPAFISQNILGPFLTRFHARYPEIELDMRIVNTLADAGSREADVLILMGWHDTPDLVQKRLAQTRYAVLASPAYWAEHGRPQRPADLARHECFAFRNPRATLLDLWEFERGGVTESVTVRGWLSSSHRNLLVDAALAGEGVVRSADLVAHHLVRLGRLVPALQDWNGLHAPPVHAVFRARQRRSPRVRAFVDFAAEVFRRLETEREGGAALPSERPSWYARPYSRASVAARRER